MGAELRSRSGVYECDLAVDGGVAAQAVSVIELGSV
jgi:hypothetical protein